MHFDVSEGDNFAVSTTMQSEVEEALKGMRPGKAVGEDGLVVEMLDGWGVGSGGYMVITEIANSIYDTGQIPNKTAQFIFMTIPKKLGAILCDKLRTICVMSQLSKIVL